LTEDKKAEPAVPSPTGFIQFENGALTKQQLDSLLNTLPVEITLSLQMIAFVFLISLKKSFLFAQRV
jgi:hypothetical protein